MSCVPVSDPDAFTPTPHRSRRAVGWSPAGFDAGIDLGESIQRDGRISPFITDHTDRRCCATTGAFLSARARRISTTPTTRNQISGGKFAMMAGPQPPGVVEPRRVDGTEEHRRHGDQTQCRRHVGEPARPPRQHAAVERRPRGAHEEEPRDGERDRPVVDQRPPVAPDAGALLAHPHRRETAGARRPGRRPARDSAQWRWQWGRRRKPDGDSRRSSEVSDDLTSQSRHSLVLPRVAACR